MNSDKLAGRLGLVSPTLALRYEDRPGAFEGLVAVEGGSAFLPGGPPTLPEIVLDGVDVHRPSPASPSARWEGPAPRRSRRAKR